MFEDKMEETVYLFTDGACSGNPGPGGWGVLMRHQGREKTLNGAEAQTTNNRMELMAAIQGLAALKKSCEVIVVTDSQYVRQGITNWIVNWKKNAWRTAARKPVKNKDLWQQLLQESERHQVEWQWVRGHTGHPENERADQLAREAIETLL